MDINTLNSNVHCPTKALARLFNSYVDMTLKSNPFQTPNVYVDNMGTAMDILLVKHQVNHLFANNSTTDQDIYPPTASEIAEAQHRHKLFSNYLEDKPFIGRDGKISSKVIDDIRVLTCEKNA